MEISLSSEVEDEPSFQVLLDAVFRGVPFLAEWLNTEPDLLQYVTTMGSLAISLAIVDCARTLSGRISEIPLLQIPLNYMT
jgi:hypothetical protein